MHDTQWHLLQMYSGDTWPGLHRIVISVCSQVEARRKRKVAIAESQATSIKGASQLQLVRKKKSQ